MDIDQARAEARQLADQHDVAMAIGWQTNDTTGERELGYCPLHAVGPAFVYEVLETVQPRVSPLEAFREAGERASFHFADDSTREWHLGTKYERQALAIFDQHPELQQEMRDVARGFLWSLSTARPESKS